MKTLISEVRYYFESNQVKLSDRSGVTVYMVARYVAACLPLPTGKVSDPTAFFKDTNEVSMNQMLSEVNEVMPIDIDETESLILKLWTMRYNLVYCPNGVQSREVIDLVICSGKAGNVPAKLTELVQTYPSMAQVITAVERYEVADAEE